MLGVNFVQFVGVKLVDGLLARKILLLEVSYGSVLPAFGLDGWGMDHLVGPGSTLGRPHPLPSELPPHIFIGTRGPVLLMRGLIFVLFWRLRMGLLKIYPARPTPIL